MPTLYLTPTAISDLTLLIFAGFITGYLVLLVWQTRGKRPFQTITLALAFISVSGYILIDFLNQTLYPDLAFWLLSLQSIFITFCMAWLMQFAYRIPKLPPEWRLESRIVLVLTLLLSLWELSYALTRYADLLEGKVTYRPSNADFVFTAVFLWLVIVFLRQCVRSDTRQCPFWKKLWKPEGHAAHASRDFTLVSLLPVVLTGVLLL